MRRYKRRWKAERLFAWFQSFRRLVVGWGREAENLHGLPELQCIVILFRSLWDGAFPRRTTLRCMGTVVVAETCQIPWDEPLLLPSELSR